MLNKRRNLLKALSLGTVMPTGIWYDAVSSPLPAKTTSNLYDKAHVIDGLIITRNWDEASFKALKETIVLVLLIPDPRTLIPVRQEQHFLCLVGSPNATLL